MYDVYGVQFRSHAVADPSLIAPVTGAMSAACVVLERNLRLKTTGLTSTCMGFAAVVDDSRKNRWISNWLYIGLV